MTVQRMTKSTELVLKMLLKSDTPVWGLLLCKKTGLPSGTIYPMLSRLEGYGWVVASWDDATTSGPRRRLYSITADGRLAAQAALSEVRQRVRTVRAGREALT